MAAVARLRGVRPGSFRNKQLPSPGAYSLRTSLFRRCGSTRLPKPRGGWHNSYEPPVRGHRHDSRIVSGGGQDGLVLLLAVIAFLSLLGLSTGVVLVILIVLLTRCWFRGRGCFLEVPYPRECCAPGWREAQLPQGLSANAGQLGLRQRAVRTPRTSWREIGSSPAEPRSGLDREHHSGELQIRRTAYRSWFRLASNHLPICTLKQARKFRSPAVNSRLDGPFRNLQNRGNFPVIHVLQVAQNDRLAKVRGELLQSPMYGFPSFPVVHTRIRRRRFVRNLLAQWHGVFMLRRR